MSGRNIQGVFVNNEILNIKNSNKKAPAGLITDSLFLILDHGP